MSKHILVVFTNAADDRDDEFNAWYTDRHLVDVLKVPGIVAAQRYRLSGVQRLKLPYPWKYLALYQIETTDLQATISALAARSGTEQMPMSDALHEHRLAYVFEPITEMKHATA